MTTPYQQPGQPPQPQLHQPGPPPQPYAQGPQPPQQQGQWQGGGAPAGHGYASPIPMERTHLGHAIASEWTKIRTVRSTIWTLSVMLVLVVGVGFLVALAMGSQDYVGMPLLGGGFFGLMLGQLCVITLGVLVVTSEYGTGMIRTTLTACPSRSRVLAAKALVFFVLTFVLTTVACALVALMHSAMLSDQTVPDYATDSPTMSGSIEAGQVVADGSQWFGATIGAGLYVALLGLLALAVGSLLRHSAGAITAMLGVVLLPLLLALFMIGESLSTVREKLIEYSPINGLATLYRIPMDGGDASGWPLLGGLAGVTAAVFVVAFIMLEKRDV
ncbi:ABC transporter permease [Streptomyces sp. H27-D2]|uniref:ABC transporter permease n=1 Tax=Streptomyces sp. H27-D2 TaxID=3046304 RepID=UPI002DB94758|nr:ABC transporter permease [Streptomyces sp. H27-D2]MEC4018399.1 ABC transporter permease [Streptomyces sp. H27-D2]